MKLRVLMSSLVLVSVLAPFCATVPATAVPITGSPTKPTKMVDGQEAFQRVTKLTTEIPWYSQYDYALKMAQQQNKPVFWMHMLGPLNGKT